MGFLTLLLKYGRFNKYKYHCAGIKIHLLHTKCVFLAALEELECGNRHTEINVVYPII